MSSDDLFEDNLALHTNLSPPSLGSTPAECSGVVGAVANVDFAPVQDISVERECPECKKVLKTRSGFTRHIALHRLNHYNSRKPLEDIIVASLPNIFKKVLDEIMEEPAVSFLGAHKKEFVAALSSSTNTNGITLLMETISSPIIECVLMRNKVMPSAQYEEALKKVDALLSDSSFCESVRNRLLICVTDDVRNKPNSVLRRLVWRLTTKFLYKIQEVVFHHMKEKHLAANDQYAMQEREMEVFKEHIGKILKSVYKFGTGSNNCTWNLRCKSLRERYVNSQEPLNDEQFLNFKLWEGKMITLSDAALKLFLGVESIIQRLQCSGSACSSDIVFEQVTSLENVVLLNELRPLSSGIMSEDLALAFLQDLIKSVVALSGKLDASRKLQRLSKKQKTSTVSLRTNLKRNPTGQTENIPQESTSSMQASKLSKAASPSLPSAAGPSKTKSTVQPGPSSRTPTSKSISEEKTSAQAGPSSRTTMSKSTSEEKTSAKPASKSTRSSSRKRTSTKKYSFT